MESALAPRTRQAYNRALQRFKSFAAKYQLPETLPIDVNNLANFISYSFFKGSPASTLSSLLSGIAYFHKIKGFPNPTDNFVITQLMLAVKKQSCTSDRRQPISVSLLEVMLSVIKKSQWSLYDKALYQAMFTLAFAFALRISEITHSPHNIQLSAVSLDKTCLKIHFTSYKHSPEHPESHSINGSSLPTCAVGALSSYISLRGNQAGPLFMKYNKPISKGQFAATLKEVLAKSGVKTIGFSSHSFRIGAATHWFNKGLSETQIKKQGRWRSNAMLHYIRGNIQH